MKYYYLILLGIVVFCFQLYLGLNYTKVLSVDSEVNIIDLKNPSIVTKKNKSIFKATLINNSDKKKHIDNIEIIIKDSNNTNICNFKIDVDKTFNSGESIKLEKEVSYDLSDAISFDYIVN